VRQSVWLALCLASCSAFAGMTATDAFNEGNTFGKANIGTAKAKISTSTASDANKGVPNYTASRSDKLHLIPRHVRPRPAHAWEMRGRQNADERPGQEKCGLPAQ